jgi:hypothetical protein
MLKFDVYYQDFRLNSCVVVPHHLILDEEDAKYIETFTLDYLFNFGKVFETDCPVENYLEAIFEILNLHNDRLTLPRIRYENAGHTSMSVGDYVIVTDTDSPDNDDDKIYMVGAAGWKLIDMSLALYTIRKNKVLARMQSIPVDILMAMASQVKDIEDEDGTFENILENFVNVENWEAKNAK